MVTISFGLSSPASSFADPLPVGLLNFAQKVVFFCIPHISDEIVGPLVAPVGVAARSLDGSSKTMLSSPWVILGLSSPCVFGAIQPNSEICAQAQGTEYAGKALIHPWQLGPLKELFFVT